MKKKAKDLLKGDIIRVQYGIEGNWVTVVVDNVCLKKIYNYSPLQTEINGKYYRTGTPISMWGDIDDEIDLIDICDIPNEED